MILAIQQKNIQQYKMQEQMIYWVLPHDTAYFKSLPQNLACLNLSQVKQGHGPESLINALKYRFPLKYLGKQAAELIVLCIPAREHEIVPSETAQHNIPLLIKTNQQTEIKGYKSGRRSGLLQIGQKLLRYKGCGNDGDGFIYQNCQLRGSHFFHTAKRQLYMTNFINIILEQEIGEKSANQPLFFYQFPQSIAELGLRNDLVLLSKYCCVFETKGDRRVGTHLISPLEILFLNAFDPSNLNLQQFFTKRERLDKFGLTELLIDFDLLLQKGKSFLSKYDQGRQFSNYVSLGEISQLGELKQRENFAEIVTRIGNTFITKQHIDLNSLLPSTQNWIGITSIILQKLGWQMGCIKRIFCKHGINWGFFNDHNMWHCNAHLNNFILRKPNTHSNFILPLDFDLAFTTQQYINIDIDSQKYGRQDLDNFQEFLLAEYNAMEISISGVEVMNFKYSIQQQQSEPSLLTKMMRVVFRDTLVQSFRHGMRNNVKEYERINERWAQNIDNISRLVESCLHISAEFQT